MAVAVQITVTNQRALNRISNILFKLPEEVAEASMDFLKLMQRNLRREVTIRGHIWRNKLWNSIQARKLSKDRSVLVMSKEGIFLDRMTPHWVKLKKGRLIREWVKKKGFEFLRVQTRYGIQAVPKEVALKYEKSIFVKPDPFFDHVFARTLINFPAILKRRTTMALQRG